MKPHQFVLHIWPEEIDHRKPEWRGRIKYLRNGEVRFFRDTATLYRALLHMLPELNEESNSDCEAGGGN